MARPAPPARPAPAIRSGLLLFLASAGYGVLMEFVQGTFLPNRFFEFDDMLANTFGAAVGWLAAHQILRRLTPIS